MASTTFTLQTQERKYYKLHPSNQTPSGVPTKGYSDTTPSGTGITDCKYANLAKLIFTGDADGNTGCAFVWGWSQLASGEWIANFIAEITFTCGSQAGSATAGSVFDTGDFFADIVELEYGDTATKVITDTQNNIASATVDLEGASKIEVQFSDTTTDAVTPTGADLNVAMSLF